MACDKQMRYLLCWSESLKHYDVTRPQWVNSFWPSDVIWRQGSRSTLAQVMACCLTAPNHYLNQCWLNVSEVQWHSSEGNFTKDASATNLIIEISLKNYLSKISFKSPRGQWVNRNNRPKASFTSIGARDTTTPRLASILAEYRCLRRASLSFQMLLIIHSIMDLYLGLLRIHPGRSHQWYPFE